MTSSETGVILTTGLSDWQIIQRDAGGTGHLELSGRWSGPTTGTVMVRLVREDTDSAVATHLDWRRAATNPDGTWSARLDAIPAGGLYRLETRYDGLPGSLADTTLRGDMRHFTAVGDLWLIAGQSNAAGYGHGPVDDPPELGLHLFRNDHRWGLASHPMNESTHAVDTVSQEPRNPGHSPFLHFARLLRRELNCPIGLVQASRGGSWLREWSSGEPDPSGALARNMFTRVAAAGGSVRGMVWYQGEAEGNALEGDGYLDRLDGAIGTWREGLGQPDLPILLVQLNRHRTAASPRGVDLSWSQVREAQRIAARTIRGVFTIPSLDLPLSDEIHTSPMGNMMLADRLARVALGGIYGRSIDFRAPDVESATTADDGRAIDLSFSPVTIQMGGIDPRTGGFEVRDARGNVGITAVQYPGGAVVRLILDRRLDGPTFVDGGVGVDPAPVPMDMVRRLPMLGFHGVPVLDD
jgi:sialate O-acetylesterase